MFDTYKLLVYRFCVTLKLFIVPCPALKLFAFNVLTFRVDILATEQRNVLVNTFDTFNDIVYKFVIDAVVVDKFVILAFAT